MLEVRYIKETGAITAWAGSPGFTGGHLEPKDGEEVIVIDCPTPDGSSGEYLVTDGQLVHVKELTPPRNLAAEIDDLKARMGKLEPKVV